MCVNWRAFYFVQVFACQISKTCKKFVKNTHWFPRMTLCGRANGSNGCQDLGEPTHTPVPCWMPKSCLQGTNVRVDLLSVTQQLTCVHEWTMQTYQYDTFCKNITDNIMGRMHRHTLVKPKCSLCYWLTLSPLECAWLSMCSGRDEP